MKRIFFKSSSFYLRQFLLFISRSCFSWCVEGTKNKKLTSCSTYRQMKYKIFQWKLKIKIKRCISRRLSQIRSRKWIIHLITKLITNFTTHYITKSITNSTTKFIKVPKIVHKIILKIYFSFLFELIRRGHEKQTATLRTQTREKINSM